MAVLFSHFCSQTAVTSKELFNIAMLLLAAKSSSYALYVDSKNWKLGRKKHKWRLGKKACFAVNGQLKSDWKSLKKCEMTNKKVAESSEF